MLVVCSVTPLIHFLVLPILTGISRLGRVSSVAMAGESGSLVTGSGLGSRPRLQSRAVSSTEVHEVSQCSEKGPCWSLLEVPTIAFDSQRIYMDTICKTGAFNRHCATSLMWLMLGPRFTSHV